GVISKDTPTNRELNEKVSNAELTGANENPGALAGATGAEIVVEAELHWQHIASVAARHPIIARHWGIVA
ncbi:MAG: hypothetical protein RQ750_17320, partial [Roseovarius sp.]|nr:hypothetical protein [Roseovarius sp.]